MASFRELLGMRFRGARARDRVTARLLRESGIFDDTHYLARNPDVRASGVEPLLHYLRWGGRERRSPHPLFDPGWYLEQHPEVAESGENPLLHYLREGVALGHDPHPLFDSAWYLERHPEAAEARGGALGHYLEHGVAAGHDPRPLFDAAWYLARHPEAAEARGGPLAHYAEQGLARGHDPHPLFDAAFYLERHPEAARVPGGALAHYAEHGAEPGHDPHPLFHGAWYLEHHPEAAGARGGPLAHYVERGVALGHDPHPLFDAAWYLARHPEAEAEPGGPLAHYVHRGEAAGLSPHPLFHPEWYREQHPDLAGFPYPLLWHYARHGGVEGRSPHPLFHAAWYLVQHPEVGAAGENPLLHYLRGGGGAGHDPHPLFDAAWYRERHPEAAEGGADPLLHYLREGIPARHDPHPLFDAAGYLERHPEAGAEPGGPLAHYVRRGEAAGFAPHPLFRPDWYRERSPDLAGFPFPLLWHYVRHGGREGRSPHPLFDAAWYLERHPDALEPGENPLLHYLREGIPARHDPHPLFDAAWYLEQHPEAAEARGGALAHYAERGVAAGHDPHPLFDARGYAESYGLPLDGSEDPLRHYCERGARAGLSPSPFFDPDWYLRRYAVRLRPGETPFGHFARKGAPRGFRPGPLFDHCIRFFREARAERRRPGAGPFAGLLDRRFARLVAPEAEREAALPRPEAPEVTVVVPSYRSPGHLRACLRSVAHAETRASFELVVVGDGPEALVVDALEAVPGARLVRTPRRLGFLRACNAGAAEARAPLLVFLNDDALVTDGWLDALVRTRARQPEAAVVGSRLLHPNGRLQEAGGLVWSDGSAANYGHGEDPEDPRYAFAREADYVSGAAMLVERRLFEELGGFDELFAPAFYEDTDLAFRARERGRRVLYQPASRVVHFGGASYGRDPRRGAKSGQERNRGKFLERWAHRLEEHAAPGSDPQEVVRERARARALVMDATTLTPDQDSGSFRMSKLLDLLRERDFDVTFVPHDLSQPARYVDALRERGVDVACPPHCSSIERFLERTGHRYELCIVSRPDVGVRWLPSLRLLCPRATILYDTVDLHFVRRERELATVGVSTMGAGQKEEELRTARAADAVLVVSDEDRRRLLAEAPELRVHLLGNVHEPRRLETPFAERSGLLFIGGFRHAPNVDAVRWLVHEILPRVREALPEAVLHVVGSEVPDEIRALAGPRVRIEGFVPDALPYFARCRVSVAPLRYGSGVKGKVNQSMSHGLPCVATPIAAEGLGCEPGEELLVAEDAPSFAEAVIRLYRDGELWERVAARGLERVEKTFSVRVARERLARILEAHGLG